MSIKLRQPPIMPKNHELSIWLRELREKMITADADTNALITAFKSGVYFGEPGTDGCYRIILSGAKLNIEKRVSSTWTKVFAFKA